MQLQVDNKKVELLLNLNKDMNGDINKISK